MSSRQLQIGIFSCKTHNCPLDLENTLDNFFLLLQLNQKFFDSTTTKKCLLALAPVGKPTKDYFVFWINKTREFGSNLSCAQDTNQLFPSSSDLPELWIPSMLTYSEIIDNHRKVMRSCHTN